MHAFVGAGGKTAAIRRLLHECPQALATTTTHLEPSGFGHGLLLVFPEVPALVRAAPARLRARPLSVAIASGLRLQGPPLQWLAEFVREQQHALVFVEADGAARCLLKLPAAHEPAWPPGPLARVVVVVGLAALGRPLRGVAHHPERFGHAGVARVRDVQRMLTAYLARTPPRAPISVLLTGTAGVDSDVIARLVRHIERCVRGREPRRADPQVPLRVVVASDVDAPWLRFWECERRRAAPHVELPGVCGILLAAGLGRRFGPTADGTTKLLQRWRGKPLVAHALASLCRAGCATVVVVTGREARVAGAVALVARGLGVRVRVLRNRDPARGLGSSVRLAARAVPPGIGLLFAHADMPALRVSTLRRIARLGTTLQHCIVRPVVQGTPRHPVFFPAALRGELSRVRDGCGGRDVLRRHPERLFGVAFDPGDEFVDVDRAADLARLAPMAKRVRHRSVARDRPPVLLIGGGDLGSGAAQALVRAGFPVVIAEKPRPLAVRRRVAFAEAARRGETVVEGLRARRMTLAEVRGAGWPARGGAACIPVVVAPWRQVIAALRPAVVVDARMRKRAARALPAALFRVALGPGHTAGRDCDAVVETARGPQLGRVLWRGSATPDTGVPGAVGGATVARLLRAPVSGVLRVHADIGARVRAGSVLARVGGRAVRAGVGGVVRGMLPDGEHVRRGQKLGDVDPRRRQPPVHRISDKARAVGRGVVAAVHAATAPPPAGRRGARASRRLHRGRA